MILFIALACVFHAPPIYRGFTATELAAGLKAAPGYAITNGDWSKFTPLQAAALEYQKCGPKGARYWDDGGPLCVRDGWNGRRYKQGEQ